MPPLIKLLNVSLYGDQEFGLRDISFELQKYGKYHINLPSRDKLNTLLGLLEGRFQPQAGVVHRYGRLFSQSDRLLLGDKVYSRNTGSFLRLADDQFMFDDRKHSKSLFLHDLKARHIRHFPVYKLRGEDRLKFALLALTFQESGIMFISDLLNRELPADLELHLQRMVRGTRCALCLLTTREQQTNQVAQLATDIDLQRIDID